MEYLVIESCFPRYAPHGSHRLPGKPSLGTFSSLSKDSDKIHWWIRIEYNGGGKTGLVYYAEISSSIAFVATLFGVRLASRLHSPFRASSKDCLGLELAKEICSS